MKKLYLAFLISLLLHILLFLNYSFIKEDIEPKEKEHSEKSDIKFVKLVEDRPQQEQNIKAIETLPQIEQKSVVEKKVEQKIEKVSPKKTKEIDSPKVVTKDTNSKKQIDINNAKKVQKDILKESSTFQENTLEKFLSQKSPINQEVLNELQQLYGKEYDNFTKVQKAYLEKT